MRWEQLLCGERRRPPRAGEPDSRTPFQKDYHRVIASASFRRLQDKTQVFPLDQSDFVRTRLTHSLEVASFAKSLGQSSFEALQSAGRLEITPRVREDAYTVLECAGLLHDIGNPPFGHFGESVIREWFRARLQTLTFHGVSVYRRLNEQMRQDLFRFDGNAQALRLVTKLHFLVDEHGMNLTYALLNTLIKYPVSSLDVGSADGDVRARKMGYTYAEAPLFREITQATGAGRNRYPLTFLLEAADDVAYLTADIEDAAKKGFLSPHMLPEELESARCRDFCQTDAARGHYEAALRRLRGTMALCKERGIADPEWNALQNWMVFVQSDLLRTAQQAFAAHYDEIMAGAYARSLFEESPAAGLTAALGDIAARYVFRSPYIVRMELAADTILRCLLDRLVPAAVLYTTGDAMSPIEERMISLVSDNYLYVYRRYAEGKSENERLYLRLLLVTDFICGMTDGYAKSLYRQFNGVD